MIRYPSARFHPNLLFSRIGSVLPWACLVALPCAALGTFMKLLFESNWFAGDAAADETTGIPEHFTLLHEPIAYSGFSALVGFFLVFRTQQAYGRFQMGAIAVHEMRGEWFDAASSLVAFCKYSDADPSLILRFQHKLIRLFSMLHAVALGDLEVQMQLDKVRAFELPLLDVFGIDEESLLQVRETDCKVELVFQWIQQLVVENVKSKVLSVPAPILTRAFQELANGMVKYHDAMVIAHIPFPFPYMQTTEVLLFLHWIFTPLLMCQWTTAPQWAFCFCFIQVLFLWSINAIATELENPFGEDANDLDAGGAQVHLNRRLLLLIRPSTIRTPLLIEKALLTESEQVDFQCNRGRNSTFIDAWSVIGDTLGNQMDCSARSRISILSNVARMSYEREEQSESQPSGLPDPVRRGSRAMTAGSVQSRLSGVVERGESVDGVKEYRLGSKAQSLHSQVSESNLTEVDMHMMRSLSKGGAMRNPSKGASVQALQGVVPAAENTQTPPQGNSTRRSVLDSDPPSLVQVPLPGSADSSQPRAQGSVYGSKIGALDLQASCQTPEAQPPAGECRDRMGSSNSARSLQ